MLAFRLFLKVTKIEISIRVFHLVCLFGHFTPVPIRVFAPFPFRETSVFPRLKKILAIKISSLQLLSQNNIDQIPRVQVSLAIRGRYVPSKYREY